MRSDGECGPWRLENTGHGARPRGLALWGGSSKQQAACQRRGDDARIFRSAPPPSVSLMGKGKQPVRLLVRWVLWGLAIGIDRSIDLGKGKRHDWDVWRIEMRSVEQVWTQLFRAGCLPRRTHALGPMCIARPVRVCMYVWVDSVDFRRRVAHSGTL